MFLRQPRLSWNAQLLWHISKELSVHFFHFTCAILLCGFLGREILAEDRHRPRQPMAG